MGEANLTSKKLNSIVRDKTPNFLKVHPEYQKLLPKLPQEEYEALKESIKTEGQHYPIVVNKEGIILDGHNRFEICKELKLEPRFEIQTFENPLLEKKFVIEANLRRRHLNKFQRAEMGIPLLDIETELAKQRQRTESNVETRSESNDANRGKATTQVSRKIGLSETTFERAKKIIEKAPEPVKQKVRNGKQSINYAYQQIQREEKHSNPPKLPEGEFDVIYADPPWKYEFAETDGTADIHYEAMETKDISSLLIPSAKDAILFLWATNPKLQDALKVMKDWGFQYLTNLVWIKGNGGIGYYFQGNHELLLVGKKGNIPAPMPSNRPSSVLQVSKTNHSSKPKEVYPIIEKMYPNRKYLELFSRTERQGWIMWGNE